MATGTSLSRPNFKQVIYAYVPNQSNLELTYYTAGKLADTRHDALAPVSMVSQCKHSG